MRCSYCGQGFLRLEQYPRINATRVTHKEVQLPPGVADRNISQDFRQPIAFLPYSFLVCPNCGLVWVATDQSQAGGQYWKYLSVQRYTEFLDAYEEVKKIPGAQIGSCKQLVPERDWCFITEETHIEINR